MFRIFLIVMILLNGGCIVSKAKKRECERKLTTSNIYYDQAQRYMDSVDFDKGDTLDYRIDLYLYFSDRALQQTEEMIDCDCFKFYMNKRQRNESIESIKQERISLDSLKKAYEDYKKLVKRATTLVG